MASSSPTPSSPSRAASTPPPRLFTCFVTDASRPSRLPAAQAAWLEARVTRYVVDGLKQVRGRPLDGVDVGLPFVRVESPGGLAMPDAPLIGVTTHLVYTSAPDRRDLTAASAPESGPTAVLIPLSKSAAWWAMAQDERQAHFQRASGHLAVGMEFASRIFRRLYHARHLPGAAWDFLTYFEFPADRAGEFERLLAGLRDVERNPEWAFVEREAEVWLTKVGEPG